MTTIENMSVSDAIEWLHANGTSKAESMMLIAKTFSKPLSEVKTLVHEHESWNGVKSRDEKFHEDLTKYDSEEIIK